MRKVLPKFVLALALVSVVGCAGVRKTGTTYVAHAEAFRIIGMAIPEDDQAAARRLVPSGATIENISATPADWTSLWGGLGNIFWIHTTQIGGTLPSGK